MSRYIDADALKDKLQQHHDFYVMAWGGFGKMPIGEKKRVDEITNCIAEVVNAPTIEPKRGEWIFKTVFPNDKSEFPMGYLVCSVCGSHHSNSTPCNYCDNCGAKMNADRKTENCSENFVLTQGGE